LAANNDLEINAVGADSALQHEVVPNVGIEAGQIFLPVVESVAIAIGEVSRTIGEQSGGCQPANKRAADIRLEFVRANIHGAVGDARPAVEIVGPHGIKVGSRIDAGGV